MNSAADESFASLCKFLEHITRFQKAEKLLKLEKYLKKFEDPYLVLRLILPSIDMERGNFGLKEHSLGKLFADVMSLPDKEKSRMLNYRDASQQEGHRCVAGDFLSVLYSVLEDRASKMPSTMTLAEVDKVLDNLTKEDKRAAMLELVRSMSSLELKWVARIILKEMKLGFDQKSVLKCLHRDALDMFNETSDLKAVLERIKTSGGEGTSKPSSSHKLLFQKLKPMLAKRFPFGKEQMLDGRSFIVETKFDGERMIAHICKESNVVELYTRNCINYTTHYKQILDAIKDSLKGEQAVLDGEMMAWDSQEERYLPFGTNRAAAVDGGVTYLIYCVFDVLYYKNDGESYNLCATPLKSRKKFLRDIIVDCKNVQVVKYVGPFDRSSELEPLLLKAIDNKEEGIMVKDVTSVYKFNYRNYGWFKMKPEHGGLTDHIDLLVIGGYFADTAKRRKTGSVNLIDNISIFLVAAVNPENDTAVSFGKVGTGYGLQQLQDMRQLLGPHIRKYDPQKPPKWCRFKFPSKTAPDCLIDDPKHGFVMECRASEITESSDFEFGHTMRFPTAKVPIRRDKNWNEAITVQQLQELTTESRMLALQAKRRREESGSEDEGTVSKRTRTVAAPSGVNRIVPRFQPTDTSLVKSVSALFASKEVFVVNGDEKYSVQEIEKYVVMHGGRYAKNRRPTTDYVVAAKMDLRTRNIAKLQIDVLRYQYLFDCEDAKELIPLRPWHMLATSDRTKLSFAAYDRFGDHYTDPTSALTFAKIQPSDEDLLTISPDLVAATRQLVDRKLSVT
eukprot:GEMP01016728.1.p1 GENE.GEMP01016728.1~~GEMP01016728.1.p1  ORF type:complete len:788 (+),score=189.85 GEMP01016728.1:182-2545(+)